jgi:inosine-uridine nucleoside N-ribohydrolase
MKLRTLIAFLMLMSFSLAAERPLAPWPPPDGPLRVIVDTDAANEVDDQFALALALGARDRLHIEGFVAAHFGGAGGSGGIDASYAELQKLLKLAGMSGEIPLKRGSDPVVYPDRIPESEGVDFIIERARAATPDDPLWLVLLGPATDAAAALMKAPDIADRLVMFWHGRTRWPVQCWNFNAYNDIKAVQIIFERPCRLVLFDAGTYLRMPWEEMERRIAPISALGQYLFDIRVENTWTKSPRKGFFDLGDIAALVDPAAVEFERVSAPRVEHDLDYDFTKDNGPIIRIFEVDRVRSFQMLEKALFVIERRTME